MLTTDGHVNYTVKYYVLSHSRASLFTKSNHYELALTDVVTKYVICGYTFPISLQNDKMLAAIKLIACFTIYELFRINTVEDIVAVLSFEIVLFKL